MSLYLKQPTVVFSQVKRHSFSAAPVMGCDGDLIRATYIHTYIHEEVWKDEEQELPYLGLLGSNNAPQELLAYQQSLVDDESHLSSSIVWRDGQRERERDRPRAKPPCGKYSSGLISSHLPIYLHTHTYTP